MVDHGTKSGPEPQEYEGKVKIIVEPTGKEKGPGSKGPVFFNPAMVQNRDLSIVLLGTLIDNEQFTGTGPIRILDGLTGSGIRAVRFDKEIISRGREIEISGVDLKETSIESALELNRLNETSVNFHQGDLNLFYGNHRYHYIDIDPFGTPVPFIQNALLSLRKGGILAVTATDTAALTGSVPRVAYRRYGVRTSKTHFMQELGARTLLGYVTRMAATFELSVDPIFFYTQDHFIRGYLKVDRGAKKADKALDNVGYFKYEYPRIVSIENSMEDLRHNNKSERIIGPVWTGPLSDPSILGMLKREIEDEQWSYLKTIEKIKKTVERGIEEEKYGPGGFDVNETSSYLGCSPPSMEVLASRSMERGFGFSRSRFSPTIVKTDAGFEDFCSCFDKGGP